MNAYCHIITLLCINNNWPPHNVELFFVFMWHIKRNSNWSYLNVFRIKLKHFYKYVKLILNRRILFLMIDFITYLNSAVVEALDIVFLYLPRGFKNQSRYL